MASKEEISIAEIVESEERLGEPIESTVEEPAADENEVDDVGKLAGVMYAADEPLRPYTKEEQRDEHRWELDPASAEDFENRASDASPNAERMLAMRHRDSYKHAR
jgi:hypothetical protein